MSIKKMMLLASALSAIVAFAAPAAASAHLEWYTDPGNVTLTGTAQAHFVGELQTSVPASGLVNEFCPVTFAGSASNNANGAHAFITEGSVETPCPTNLSAFGCEVEEVTFNLGENGWTLTTTTPDIVQIHEVTFTNVNTAPCAAFGLPHEVSTAGTISGTLTAEAGPEGEDCVDFNEEGGLKLEANNVNVRLEGQLCLALPLTLG